MLDAYGEVLSLEDLKEILMIGTNSAYKLLREQKIQAFRIGNRWKIPKDSVIHFLSNPA